MKATGIVRRIDELGRVVIPKEIRRTQRIRQGDALEIFTAADGQVVFKKYSPLVELGELAGVYAEVLAKNLGRPVLVCDRESIVAATGTGKGQLLGRQISDAAARLLAMRGPYTAPETAARRITAFDKGETVLLCVCPIVVQGDVEGGVLLTGRPQDAAPDAETARALADYTGCAAVATTPQAEDLCIAHFEVVQVGRYSAAVLAVTSSGGVRTRVARIHTGLTREDADEMARLLNSSLTFVAPEDLTPSLTASLVLSAGRRLAPVVFAAEALVRTRPQFYLEGVQYLAKMPDVRTNLGALLEVFSDNEAARALIEPGSGKVTATLGEDIEPAMPNLCIVSKRYLAGGGLYGTVAVIGSNRMEYEHLIPVLNYFAIKLGQSMSGKKEEQT